MIFINTIEKWEEVFQNGVDAPYCYVLTKNLVFKKQPSIPRLSGSFNGKCNSLTFDYPNHSGFFRLTGGTISNVVVKQGVSGIIAENQGGLTNTKELDLDNPDNNEIIQKVSIVKNCKYIGNVSGIGCSGLIAPVRGTIYNQINIHCCKTIGNVSGSYTSGVIGIYFSTGGKGLVEDCSFKGDVNGYRSSGVVGSNAGSPYINNEEIVIKSGNTIIKRCHAEGNVFGNALEENVESSGVIGTFFGSGKDANGYVEDCWLKGNVYGNWTAGVIGALSASNSGNVHVQRCYAIGLVEADKENNGSSGVIGTQCASSEGTLLVEDCWFKGNVRNYATSGVVGFACGNSGNVTIRRCYMEGNVEGTGNAQNSGASGVIGCQLGQWFGKALVEDCRFKGNISGEFTSGVVGSNPGYIEGNVIIKNCSCNSVINGKSIGGICGNFPSLGEGVTTIENCKFNGKILGDNNGGIVANQSYNWYPEDPNFPGGKVYIKNCSSKCFILGNNSGGIIGSNSRAEITNCCVSGCISGYNNGGICGPEANLPKALFQQECSVKNSKVYSKVCGNSIGGIFGSNSDNPTAENVCLTGIYVNQNGAVIQSGKATLTGKVVAIKPSQAASEGEVVNEDKFFITKNKCKK